MLKYIIAYIISYITIHITKYIIIYIIIYIKACIAVYSEAVKFKNKGLGPTGGVKSPVFLEAEMEIAGTLQGMAKICKTGLSNVKSDL